MKRIMLIGLSFVYFIACNETPNSPTNSKLLTKNHAITNEIKTHKITMGTTSSNNSPSISEKLKNIVKFRATGNISIENKSGYMTITSNNPNNNFLPRNIYANSKEISYKIKGKKVNIPFRRESDKIERIIKENRKKQKNKKRIDWKSMNVEEKIIKFNELGYKTTSLENDLIEISRDIDPLGNGNYMHIKTIINIKNQIPKSSKLYKDGKLISEHIDKTIDGKRTTVSKIYGKKGLRKENNFVIINEYE